MTDWAAPVSVTLTLGEWLAVRLAIWDSAEPHINKDPDSLAYQVASQRATLADTIRAQVKNNR